MQKYQNNVTDLTGSAVVGVQVTVTTIGGVLATIYSDNGGTEAPNPLTTDSNGYIEFYAPNGRYDITVAGAGGYTDVLIVDGVEVAENALTKDEAAAPDGAALVGLGPYGIGMIPMTAEDKLREIVSLANFGAVGDGVTDDTVAIRNAVDYALTNVCDLHGVAGRTYRITGEINFPKKHSGVIREYITFDGHGCKFFLDGTNLTGFGFTKAAGGGLFDGANYYLIFKNINWKSVVGSGCIAIRAAGFVTSQFINLHFDSVDYPFWSERDDPRGTPNHVQSPRILECYSVRHKRFFTAIQVYDFTMDGTLIDAGVDGILIDLGPTGQSAYGMRITGNCIQSQTGIGVVVGGATGMVIENNYWENNAREFVANHSGTIVNYGGSIRNNFIQPKASPPPERLAAFDLGGCSSSGFKLGGNVSQDQKLFNWNSGLTLGYFDATNDRSALTQTALWDPVTRPAGIRAILSIAHRYGVFWAPEGGVFLNPRARGIEYTYADYDYVDPVDSVRIPILMGMAVVAPAGFGGGLDGLGVSPQQAPALYTQKAFARGSFLWTSTPANTANATYESLGFLCTDSGRPGTWVEITPPTKKFSSIFTVDGANNRVGVNTATPTVPLQVTGTSRFYGNGSFSVGWGDSSDLGRLSRAGSVPNISGLTNGLDINTTASVPITITTNGTERARFDGAGNLLLGGTTTPTSARAAVVLTNGVAPTASVVDGVALYAEDVASSSELKVRDEAGNVTTLSPHNFSLIPGGASEEMAWAYYSERGGKRINVDMLKLARLVEKLAGEQIVFED